MARKKKLNNGWEIHEILEPDTKVRYNKYFHKRKIAPRIELDSKLSQQLAAYTLIEKDLRNALIWLEKIEKMEPEQSASASGVGSDRDHFNLIKGLYVAALTIYGKCFTSCEGRFLSLPRKFPDKEFRKFHDQIMHMRHNFAAHSGSDNFEEVKVVLVLYPNKRSNAKPFIYRELMQPDYLTSTEISFIDLVKHIQSKVNDKIRILSEKIFEDEVRPKGKDYWYKIASKPIKRT
ncbi:hypothetical protein A7985_09085 [Pseudoalteromonas luteoviolacea]|uniref:Uncharacterized protein n=1 Tax=Pseudoalteromonas luteoviolacea TaxID=43657 RepID=A0A1C0TRS7_9GAMM|nr:hypothetical protein [Pseudoalteromonas luteoviolacea]OCQ21953.1 hypothetical protein A7985_09085 [Pseudoalteromonas luteoviolacea]